MNRRLKKLVRRSERETKWLVERLHGNGFWEGRSTPLYMLDQVGRGLEPYALAGFAYRLTIQGADAYYRAFRQHRQGCFVLAGIRLATLRRAA